MVGALQGPQQLEPFEARRLLHRAGAAAGTAPRTAPACPSVPVSALIFTMLMRGVIAPSPSRHRRGVNHRVRHPGGRDRPVTPEPRTADLGFARLDLDRAARTGTAEVVFAGGKSRLRPWPAWPGC